jgi:outer membrane immunogenic protein
MGSLAVAGAAFAAEASSVHDWSGLYAGINVGVNQNTYNFTDLNSAWNGSSDPFKSLSVAPGIKAGYNWQFGQLVLGLEGDYNLNLGSTGKQTYCVGLCNSFTLPLKGKVDSYGSLRTRGGIAIDRTLLYLTAGGAYGEGSQRATYNALTSSPAITENWTSSGSWWGVTAGAGAEYALTDRVSVNAEYLHTTFSSNTSSGTCVAGPCQTASQWNMWPELDTVRIGMSYKLTE